MSDTFASQSPSLVSPAVSLADVTPDDNNDLPVTARSLFIGTGGAGTAVVVIAVNDTVARTFKNVPSGSVLSVRAKRVKSTGTTATDIIALS